MFTIASIMFISFYVHFYPSGPDYGWCKWSLLIALGCAILSKKIYDKLGLLPALCILNMALSCVYSATWFDNNLQYLGDEAYMTVTHYGLYALVALFSMYFIVTKTLTLNPQAVENMWIAIGFVAALTVIIQFVMGYRYSELGGVFGNISINASFSAFVLPLCFNRTKKIVVPAITTTVLAVFLCTGSVPVGVLIVSLSAYAFSRLKTFKAKMWASVCLVVVPLIVGCFVNADLFNDSARFEAFGIFFDMWVRTKSILFGTGSGTFPIFAILEQNARGFLVNTVGGKTVGTYLIWAHNDWLQILIENGVIGLTLVVSLFLQSLVKTWKKPRYFAVIAAYGACMVFLYPVHYAIHALFVCWVIAVIYRA